MSFKQYKSSILNPIHGCIILYVGCSFLCGVFAQRLDRVYTQGKPIFVSGGNIAWINFARDVGVNATPLSQFEALFQEVKQHHGNTLRLWIHTNGARTPSWDGFDVASEGNETIEDLKAILDTAQQYNIRLLLCLWSFDMLRKSYGNTITNRSMALLNDSTKIRTYINNALIPMVKAVKGHPAILAWEIFNEPEGMTTEFGWDLAHHVPMTHIQRFINMTAGVIHRTDPAALVTNGSASIATLTDVQKDRLSKTERLSREELSELQLHLNEKYQHPFTEDQTQQYHESIVSSTNRNYYSDAELIRAGNDLEGTLDFYTFHYYEWGGKSLSPFHQNAGVWKLDKSIIVAEFYMKDTFAVSHQNLYETLYKRGYAGALGWQWYDRNSAELGYNWTRILTSMQKMWTLYPQDIILGNEMPTHTVATLSNYPNPFSNSTTLVYQLPQASPVSIELYDLTGQLLQTWSKGIENEGKHAFTVEITDIPNGVYLLYLKGNSFQVSYKVVVLR